MEVGYVELTKVFLKKKKANKLNSNRMCRAQIEVRYVLPEKRVGKKRISLCSWREIEKCGINVDVVRIRWALGNWNLPSSHRRPPRRTQVHGSQKEKSIGKSGLNMISCALKSAMPFPYSAKYSEVFLNSSIAYAICSGILALKRSRARLSSPS